MVRAILILMCCSMTSLAQELIPMGTWRSHFNYENTYRVEETKNKIFATTKNGVIYYDPSDNSLSKLTKNNGLSDSQVSAIAYNSTTEKLTLGYTSGNIDVISSEGITNFRTLVDSDIVDDKSINDISFFNENVNLATSFGLLVLDLETGMIRDAYRNLGEDGEITIVNASTIWNDNMYLATPIGVLMGSLVSGINLQDFNNWNRFNESTIYNQNVLSVETFNNTVYALSSEVIYKLENEDWVIIEELNEGESEYLRLHVQNNSLLVIRSQGLSVLSTTDEIQAIELLNTEKPNDALVNSIGEIWYADNAHGLTKYSDIEPLRFTLNGPVSDEVYRLSEQNSVISTYPILDTNIDQAVTNGYGFSTFSEGVWNTYDTDELQSLSNISMYHEVNDIEYVASFGKGLLDKTQGLIYDENNSPLTREGDNILITGLDSDVENNLWISNLSSSPLIKLSENGTFSSFDLGTSQTEEPTSIQINSFNQVWLTLGLNDGLGAVGFDIETEESRYISESSAGLPSNEVNDITFDKDGSIWFATSEGVAFFSSPFQAIQNDNLDVVLPVIENNFLFRDINVNTVTIDGGNRKWMATENGAWLFDEEINETLLNFTFENSPLPSNNVLDIAINGFTGEVFFATDQGVVSYRADATEANIAPNQVAIYPNPVMSDFHGTVGFQGLIENANLKITTTSGRLVREIQAAGAGAGWDLNDYNGSRVKTGIYLVFSASADGIETYVGKIAVIN